MPTRNHATASSARALRRALWFSACFIFLSGCGGCGGSVPKTGGTQKPGQGCQSSQDCENGLFCEANACVYERCNSAPDPIAFCAERLDVSQERAVCDSGTGDCSIMRSSVGGPCEGDDICVFGSICEEGACIETCVSSASCRTTGEVCIERTGGGAKYCQPSPGCASFEDPVAHCSDVLGVEPEDVSCNSDSGECEVYERDPGEPCRFDAQCAGEAVCEEMACTTLCTEDSDCSVNRICQPRLGDTDAKICQIESCLFAPDPDLYCFQQLGDDTAYCDFEGVCQRDVSLTGQIIMVFDDSIGEPCSETIPGTGGGASPGLDLTYAVVTNGFGDSVLGTGRVVAFEPGVGPGGNAFVDGDPFGVNSPAFSDIDQDTGCVSTTTTGSDYPEFRSLGCGGAIAFEFFTDQGAPVLLDEEKLMLIGEHGSVCSPDFFEEDLSLVYLCRDPTAVREQQDMSSCDLLLDSEQFDGIIIAYLYALEEGDPSGGF